MVLAFLCFNFKKVLKKKSERGNIGSTLRRQSHHNRPKQTQNFMYEGGKGKEPSLALLDSFYKSNHSKNKNKKKAGSQPQMMR